MCNFYKNMNIFFVKLAMLVVVGSVVIFFGGIFYFLIFDLFNEQVSSFIEFDTILNFLMYTIIPFATSWSIVTKVEPDMFLENK